MLRLTESLRLQFSVHGVDERMGLNCDQLWQCLCPPKENGIGQKDDREKPSLLTKVNSSPYPKKYIMYFVYFHVFYGFLIFGLRFFFQAAEQAAKEKPQARKRLRVKSHDPEHDVRLDAISGWRGALTSVTSTWSDGTRGPLGFCVKEGFLPQKYIEKVNQSPQNIGRVYICVIQTDSHMMTSETTLELWRNLYGPAMVQRRLLLNLPPGAKGLLIVDAFSGNHSFLGGEEQRRKLFAEEFHCVLPLKMAGGWSAKGQPCDQVHSVFRRAMDDVLDNHLGFGNNLLDRPLYEELQLSAAGTIRRQIKSTDVIECSLEAWGKVPQAQFAHAWVVTRLVSLADM